MMSFMNRVVGNPNGSESAVIELFIQARPLSETRAVACRPWPAFGFLSDASTDWVKVIEPLPVSMLPRFPPPSTLSTKNFSSPRYFYLRTLTLKVAFRERSCLAAARLRAGPTSTIGSSTVAAWCRMDSFLAR